MYKRYGDDHHFGIDEFIEVLENNVDRKFSEQYPGQFPIDISFDISNLLNLLNQAKKKINLLFILEYNTLRELHWLN